MRAHYYFPPPGNPSIHSCNNWAIVIVIIFHLQLIPNTALNANPTNQQQSSLSNELRQSCLSVRVLCMCATSNCSALSPQFNQHSTLCLLQSIRAINQRQTNVVFLPSCASRTPQFILFIVVVLLFVCLFVFVVAGYLNGRNNVGRSTCWLTTDQMIMKVRKKRRAQQPERDKSGGSCVWGGTAATIAAG